jgi:hypothetical protein
VAILVRCCDFTYSISVSENIGLTIAIEDEYTHDER